MDEIRIEGRLIMAGRARGQAMKSAQPLGFFGFVDTATGAVSERGHELFGRSIAGKVLVFPRGKGSTVGSYALYDLAFRNLAPAALVMESCEPVIAVGAIIAGIPAVDGIDLSLIYEGDEVEVRDGTVIVTPKSGA